jgi:hypothetical protein
MARRKASRDRRTRRATSIHINRTETLVKGAAAFLAPHSFEDLAHLQGVKPLEDINILAGGFPQDEDIDEFLEDIYEHRGIA